MAYIYFDDLKEILPGILEDWIDKDDEGWEWIFQEIEQKCYLGKKKKDKKKWKTKIESMVDTHSTALSAQRNDINELTEKVNMLKMYVTNNLSSRINALSNDVKAAKTMAEIDKRRTEVDYSKTYRTNLWTHSQQIIKACEVRGATKDELEQLDLILSKYVPNPAMVTNPEYKACTTCKHWGDNKFNCQTCYKQDEWEAKDNG